VQESVPESLLEPAESKPAELGPGILESAAPLETPVQSNADAIGAASLSEPGQQGEVNAITEPASESSAADGDIDTRRNQCIAQCERDDCDDKAGGSDELCRHELQHCRESCE